MLGARQNKRSRSRHRASSALRPSVNNTQGFAAGGSSSMNMGGIHPLTNVIENEQLLAYESRVKNAFDHIVPVLKQVSGLQHEADFELHAQRIAREELGFELPQSILADAWVQQLDMKQLFAWCVFESYRRFSDDFFSMDPLGSTNDAKFDALLRDCGFHTLDISPCADGRLAHVIRYVLRLPYRLVRRRSYAGALFDIDDSLDKWVEVELKRFRDGQLNDHTGTLTRYLKAAVYHHSSVDPDHEGCAAHGSNTALAAEAGMERLVAFRQAVENTHCCGASIDFLLMGLDTDTDMIRIHIPDQQGGIDLERYIDAGEVYLATQSMSATAIQPWIENFIRGASPQLSDGMLRLMTYLIVNNLSQIDYVKQYYNASYSDIGHAERFIGAGIGFEEIQLRNLTYFSYLHTVEEATADLDVGIKIFSHLNVSHGLPIPMVIRFDYHGDVPGARERAIERCERVVAAVNSRYAHLCEQGLLHTLSAVRDMSVSGKIDVLACSVKAQADEGAH